MGAIHNRVLLDDNEVEPAREVGLPVLDGPGRAAFSLPCPKLSGTRCTIYGRRPAVCLRYKCALLNSYEGGQITFEGARAKVDHALRLLDAVLKVLPAGLSLPAARKLAVPASGRDFDAELRLRVTALELYLDKNFRLAKEGRILEMTEVEP